MKAMKSRIDPFWMTVRSSWIISIGPSWWTIFFWFWRIIIISCWRFSWFWSFWRFGSFWRFWGFGTFGTFATFWFSGFFMDSLRKIQYVVIMRFESNINRGIAL